MTEQTAIETIVVTGQVEESEAVEGDLLRRRTVILDFGSLLLPHDDWSIGDVYRKEGRPAEVIIELDGPAISPQPPTRLHNYDIERGKDQRPAFFCKFCGWSEDPTNGWQVKASDHAFHAPCPAPPDDPGMAESPPGCDPPF